MQNLNYFCLSLYVHILAYLWLLSINIGYTKIRKAFAEEWPGLMDPIFVSSAYLHLKKASIFPLNLVTWRQNLHNFLYSLLMLHNRSHATIIFTNKPQYKRFTSSTSFTKLFLYMPHFILKETITFLLMLIK